MVTPNEGYLDFQHVDAGVSSHDRIVPTHLKRARVPGGWIVMLCDTAYTGLSICFVPDADHTWDGKSLP